MGYIDAKFAFSCGWMPIGLAIAAAALSFAAGWIIGTALGEAQCAPCRLRKAQEETDDE